MKEILDIKGLLMHSFFRCSDSGSHYRDANGKKVASAEAAFDTFLESYLNPIIESGIAPIDILAVWEGGNQRRVRIYRGYKEKRRNKETDPVVEQQLDKLYNYTKSFLLGIGATNVITPTVEADDTIAYLVSSKDTYCTVHTVDHDLVQLHSDTCKVVIKGEYADDEAGFGVPPTLIPVYKAIVGDPSDEYPGVPGLGKAAFKKLLDEYEEDGLLELAEMGYKRNRSELKEIVESGEATKELAKISEHFGQFCTMLQLSTLHPEWCHSTYKRKVIRPEWHRRVPSEQRVLSVLNSTGSEDFYRLYEPYMPVTVLVTKDNVDSVLYSGDFLDDLNERPVAFDYETYDTLQYQGFKDNSDKYVDVLSQKIVGASFTWGKNYQKTVYISVGHSDTENNCDPSVIEDMLEACDKLVAHNASFEETVTYTNFGEDKWREKLFGKIADTTIFASYRDENESSGLKHQSKIYLNYNQTTYEEVVGDKEGMHELTSDEVFSYGADDAIVTAHLYHLNSFVVELEGTRKFMEDHEFVTTSVFSDSFRTGCRIDLEQLSKMSEEDGNDLAEKRKRLRQILEENCTEENVEAADRYMGEISDFEVAKMRASGKSEEEISEKLSDIREKFIAGTKYVPYTEDVIPYNFIPTVKQFQKVFYELDPEWNKPLEIEELRERFPEYEFSSSEDDPRFLGTVAPTKISEEYAIKREFFSPKVKKLMSLVLEAAHQFKQREGNAYSRLKSYVESEVMAAHQKVVASGDELNLDSPVQMAHLLYGKLDLPIRNYTKVDPGSTRDKLGFGGGPSSNNKSVEIALAEDAPEGSWKREVLELVIDIKSIETKFKFYYNPYPNWVRPDTGKIHPQCKNCGTVTKRPSGSSPNILQVKKGPIRSIYLPAEEGHVLVAPDFSGQELRILGSESKDPVILDAYLGENKKDLHSLTASAITPKIAATKKPDIYKQIVYDKDKKVAQDYEQFCKWRASDDETLREFAEFVRNKRAKGVNFLVNYEGGAGTLSTDLLVPKDEAQEFIDGMFALYTHIPKFQEESHKLAALNGMVRTAYGNIRHMTDAIVSRDDGERMRMERQASNYRIQGCAADILKVVVTECHRTGLLEDTGAVIIAPVYDELVCSVPVENLVEFCQRLQKIMDLTPPGHEIPMMSEFSVGFDWFNMVETGTDTSEGTLLKAVEEAAEKRRKLKGEEND